MEVITFMPIYVIVWQNALYVKQLWTGNIKLE